MRRLPGFARALAGIAGLLVVFTSGVIFGAGQREAAAQSVQRANRSLEQRVARLETLLTHLSRQGNDVYITGANLHVVNGKGSTETKNGLGNLILGYNELRENDPNDRSGSHNLVIGQKNGYSSYGGVVFGLYNNSFAPFTTVCGGAGNRPQAFASSIAGGRDNVVTGQFGVVSGGHFNTALADYSSVSGGLNGEAAEENNWSAGSLHEAQ